MRTKKSQRKKYRCLVGLTFGITLCNTTLLAQEAYYGADTIHPLVEISEKQTCKNIILSGGIKVNDCTAQNGARTTQYQIKDHLKSVRVVLGGNTIQHSCEYDPYGKISQTPLPTCLYQGTYSFQKNMEQYNTPGRFYDPATGRFHSQDALYQNWSTYSFTNNNPIDFVDPNGNMFSWFKRKLFGDSEQDFLNNRLAKAAPAFQDLFWMTHQNLRPQIPLAKLYTDITYLSAGGNRPEYRLTLSEQDIGIMLGGYTGDGISINRFIRTGSFKDMEERHQSTATHDELFNSEPEHKLRLYRATLAFDEYIRTNRVTRNITTRRYVRKSPDFNPELKEGDIVTDRAYISTTTQDSFIFAGAPEFIFSITGLPASIPNSYEEKIYPRGTKFLVTGKDRQTVKKYNRILKQEVSYDRQIYHLKEIENVTERTPIFDFSGSLLE